MTVNSKTEKAYNAVCAVKKKLEGLGFAVSAPRNPSANGHDLVCLKKGRGLTVEVKAAFFSKRAWKTSKICKTQSDVIAVVFPSGRVHFEMTSIYLNNCAKDGSRSMTLIGFIYE